MNEPPNIPLEADEEWVQCPYCGTWFRSYRNDDPLKHHVEYCEKNPEAKD